MKLIKRITARIKSFWSRTTKSSARTRRRVGTFVDRRPFASFFVALGILFVLIVISNVLGAPKPPAERREPAPKQVGVYSVGTAPRITVQAQIEKSGVIRITALSPGVVSVINKQPGDRVTRGEILLNLASNYQGGSSASLQRQLAQTQYKNAVDTYDLQKDLLKKQRDVAEKTDVMADELRVITDQSLQDTNSLISLNNQILTSLDQNLAELESTNTGGANDDLILSTRQMKTQFLAANNQAKQASRSAQFNAASDKAPAELSNLQKDIALKQLDLQEKMLDVNREISRIQLQISQVAEAMMYPAAPFNGAVQRVFVKPGQQVTPGTELMVLSEDIEQDPVAAIAYVSADVARKLSKLEQSTIHISPTVSFKSTPAYVSQDAVQGQLHAVYFNIPDLYAGSVTEKGFIKVELPVGYADTAAAAPFIPIDAVYQTKDRNYVFVVSNGRAQAKTVTLGQVFGSSVEVQKGLSNSDRIILDRSVVAGDRVAIR